MGINPTPGAPIVTCSPTGATQSVTPNVSYVSERDGEKVTEVGCCVYGGTDVECFLVVWDATNAGAIIQVLGAHSIFHIQRLASGGA